MVATADDGDGGHFRIEGEAQGADVAAATAAAAVPCAADGDAVANTVANSVAPAKGTIACCWCGRRVRLHYAFVMVAVVFGVVFVAGGVRSTPALLTVPFETEYGWGRSEISGAMAINVLLYGVVGPFAVAIIEAVGVRRTVAEHYLRDDIPCRAAGCSRCASLLDGVSSAVARATTTSTDKKNVSGVPSLPAVESAAVLAARAAAATVLSPEPAGGTYLIVDAGVASRQIDVLERGGGVLDDVVVLQTASDGVRTASARTYARLMTLVTDASRRYVPFANEHARETYTGQAAGESGPAWARRKMVTAAAWLAGHFHDLDAPLRTVLLTEDDELAAAAGAAGVTAMTPAAYLDERAAAAAAAGDGTAGDTIMGLRDMLAAAPVDGGSEEVGPATRARSLYTEHWTPAAITTGLRARTCLQGTLRVNRDCWFEARVTVHGVNGRADAAGRALTGGDDFVSVLVLGRASMNRAFDGDAVAIQLLPRSCWRQPTVRLSVKPGATTEEDDAEEARTLGGEWAAAVAAASGPDAVPATMDDLRDAMRAIAAAKAAGGATTALVPTARVVGVLRRNWRQYAGSLEGAEEVAAAGGAGGGAAPTAAAAGGAGAQDGGAAAVPVLFVPADPRVPRIRLDTRQRGALADKRIIVAVDSWEAGARHPRGHYVRALGPIGDRRVEADVILFEHDVATRPFSPDVLACLPPANWDITPENSVGRVDLRGITIASVDPPGCKDIDDALHARWMEDGTVEVGVHIADVSYFVRAGSAIDAEAATRANTTYLVERRLDMLPGLLTETLCSLKGGVDRFAFSVTWRYRPVRGAAAAADALPAGRVLTTTSASAPGIVGDDAWELVPGSTRYFRSMIHSSAALTYAAAQALLDNAADASPVAQGIKLLASVARCLRATRRAAGALSLASSEVKFLLDSETHEPLDVSAYETRETNSMVEEFMLLANCAVAARTAEAFPRYALLRRHPVPPARNFDALLAAAAAVGVTLDTSSSRALADSLDAAAVSRSPYFNRLLRILATRCMTQATYFSSGTLTPPEYAHYGLAAPIYTHFTSPIRRYADVIVHRLLAAALELEPLPHAYEERAGMRALCDNMNRRHLMSQMAGRASSSLHTNLFFKGRVVVEQGLVMRLKANGAVVLIPRFGLEGVLVLGVEPSPAGGGSSGGSGSGRAPRLRLTTGARSANAFEAWAEGTATATRVLAFDNGAQELHDAADPALGLRIFDEVRVAVFVTEAGRGMKELQLRLIDPPFAPGFAAAAAATRDLVVEDKTAGRTMSRNNVVAGARLGGLVAAAAADGGDDDADAVVDTAAAAGGAGAGAAAGAAPEVAGVKRGRGEATPHAAAAGGGGKAKKAR